MRITRVLAALACAVSVAACTSQVPPSARTQPPAAASPDFEGDGRADLAYIDAHFGSIQDVRVRYGSGSLEVFTPIELTDADDGNLAGPILATDLNADGYGDLVVVGTTGIKDESNLYILFGSTSGLLLESLRVIPAPDGIEAPLRSPLAVIDEPVRRLVVGYGGDFFAGAAGLAALRLGADGLPGGEPLLLAEGTNGVPRLPSRGNGSGFGNSLAGLGNHLFIGAPNAFAGSAKEAGAIVDVTLDESGVVASRVIDQVTAGVDSDPEPQEHFGTSLSARDGYLAVGSPGDRVDGSDRRGVVHVFTVTDGELASAQQITQPDQGPTNDGHGQFGTALALGTICPGAVGVIVGGPGSTTPDPTGGPAIPNGAAWVIPLAGGDSDCAARQLYDGHGLPGTPADSRGLGSAVAVIRDRGADVDTVVIGAEGQGGCLTGAPGRLFLVSGTGSTVRLDESPRALAGA